MKVIFLAMFLLLISSAQAISAKDFNFNITSTSIQSNEQAHELLGKLYGNGTTKDSTKLNHIDVFVTSENEHKHELSIVIRKGGGGIRGGGGGRGGRGGGRGGSGRGKAGVGAGAAAGTAAGATVAAGAGTIGVRGIRGGNHSHNAAPSLFLGTQFCVSKFMLYLCLALTTLFPIH